MAARRIILTALTVFGMASGIGAQTSTTTSTTTGSTQMNTSITGTVVSVEGNWLLVKTEPQGIHEFFNVPASRQFIIDGVPKTVHDLKIGTILTATVVTINRTVMERTTSVLNGTVWYVSGNYVILTLPNGENHDYTVEPDFKFTVEGKPASVGELRKGMKVSATKIVEQPKVELSSTVTVTGRLPK